MRAMMESTLAQAANSMRGTLQGTDLKFRGVSTDTRTLREGELFFALQGPNFDGAAFIDAAVKREASGAVVPTPLDADIPVIVVDDTMQALGLLAAAWRQKMPATVIGITGSNGKTTLKEMLASCLALSAETLPTQGNLNNEIGVPLMLARLGKEHRYAVIEIGANHAGEIARMTALVQPKIVGITNAAPAHLEGFGSVEGVAQAKGEILTSEIPPEIVVLNADDQFFSYWCSLVPDVEVISFGLAPQANFRASDVYATEYGSAFTMHTPEGEIQIALPLFGAHNVLHACAAAAIASSLKIDELKIKEGLETVQPVAGRLQAVHSKSGDTLYDDSYNANPVSVVAAAKFLAAQPGNSWLVLGDMAELGDDAAELHASVGSDLKRVGITHLFATGESSRHMVEAFGDGGLWFDSQDQLIEKLKASLDGNGNVLVKGSRSMGMELVVRALQNGSDKVRGE
jgi:UDP-N-acetylmuramoyl-tripeptide--D-alanyl-D-alanine ligase